MRLLIPPANLFGDLQPVKVRVEQGEPVADLRVVLERLAQARSNERSPSAGSPNTVGYERSPAYRLNTTCLWGSGASWRLEACAAMKRLGR